MSDDEDLEWEEWMKLTDAQQDAIVAREMAEYRRWLDGLTIAQQVAHHRRCELRGIPKNRRRLRNPKLARVTVIDDLW